MKRRIPKFCKTLLLLWFSAQLQIQMYFEKALHSYIWTRHWFMWINEQLNERLLMALIKRAIKFCRFKIDPRILSKQRMSCWLLLSGGLTIYNMNNGWGINFKRNAEFSSDSNFSILFNSPCYQGRTTRGLRDNYPSPKIFHVQQNSLFNIGTSSFQSLLL